MRPCIVWVYPPRNSSKSEGPWVTSRMAVYLEAVAGAMRRSTGAGVYHADGNRKGWKWNVVSPLSFPKPSSRASLRSSFWHYRHSLQCVFSCDRLRGGSDLGPLLPQPACSFLTCLQPLSLIYSFPQSTHRNEGYGPSPPGQPPPFPLLQNK